MRRSVTFIGVIGVLAASFVTAETAQGVDATATPDVSVTKLADATFGFQDCATLLSQHATFRFTRTDTTGSLDVSISTSGSAVAGEDYVAPASVAFPDGVASVDLSIDGASSRAFLVPARTRSLTMTVDAGSGYTVGTPGSAEASITHVVPGQCAPATFAGLPVNQLQTIGPGELPQPLVVDPAPPGAALIYFSHPSYPPDTPRSWFPPDGLGWYFSYDGRPNQFTWSWQLTYPPVTPVTIAPGAYSFDVVACAYYQQIAIYYWSQVFASSCSTIKFNLNVEAANTRLPSFTG